MRIDIPVITRLQDNGDGGYTMYCYNSNEELIADHPSEPQTQQEIDNILNEDDPYENGYIGKDTINIEYNPDTGTAVLADVFSMHAGQ